MAGTNEIVFDENGEASCTCGSNRLAIIRKREISGEGYWAVIVCDDCYSSGSIS